MFKIRKISKVGFIAGVLVLSSATFVAASPAARTTLKKVISNTFSRSQLTKEQPLTPTPTSLPTPTSIPVSPTSPAGKSALEGMTLLNLHKGSTSYCSNSHLAEIQAADQAIRANTQQVTNCYKAANAFSDAGQRYEASKQCDALIDNTAVQNWKNLKAKYCVDKFFYDNYGLPPGFSY